MQGEQLAKDETLDVQSHIQGVIEEACTLRWDDKTFIKKVKQNQVKRIRYGEKFRQASFLGELGLSLGHLQFSGDTS